MWFLFHYNIHLSTIDWRARGACYDCWVTGNHGCKRDCDVKTNVRAVYIKFILWNIQTMWWWFVVFALYFFTFLFVLFFCVVVFFLLLFIAVAFYWTCHKWRNKDVQSLSFPSDSRDLSIRIPQGCFTSTEVIVKLPRFVSNCRIAQLQNVCLKFANSAINRSVTHNRRANDTYSTIWINYNEVSNRDKHIVRFSEESGP